MDTKTIENSTALRTPCIEVLHTLGKQALQTKDLLTHNTAIRGIISHGFDVVGSLALAECSACHEPIKVSTHALIIDPQV